MKKKLNWIDYILIFVLVAVIILIGLKYVNSGKISSSQNDYKLKEVILLVNEVEEYIMDSLEIGDNIYSQDSNSYYGRIKNMEIEDNFKYIVKDNGEVILTRNPERYNIIISVECKVLERENRYLSEGITEIKVNSTGQYRTIGSIFQAETISIKGSDL